MGLKTWHRLLKAALGSIAALHATVSKLSMKGSVASHFTGDALLQHRPWHPLAFKQPS